MIKLTLLVLLLAVVLSTCATPPRHANFGSAFTFPADQPVDNGNAITKVCGRCCQDGSYCGQLAEDTTLYDEANPSQGRVLEFPKGSNLTCLLRARDVFGAVDGGLCIPSMLSADRLPATFCTSFDQVLQLPHADRTMHQYAHLTDIYCCLADLAVIIHAHRRHVSSRTDCSVRLWYML